MGAAARRLGQTQPTMGRRLRALEEAIGTTLFQRTRDGFVLTDEGQAMLAHAVRMEDEAAAMQRHLAGSVGGLDGLLRVSCSDWFGATLLSPVLAEFAELHPRVTVEVLTDIGATCSRPKLIGAATTSSHRGARYSPAAA